jgi:hypothetical protein
MPVVALIAYVLWLMFTAAHLDWSVGRYGNSFREELSILCRKNYGILDETSADLAACQAAGLSSFSFIGVKLETVLLRFRNPIANTLILLGPLIVVFVIRRHGYSSKPA